MNYSIHDNQKNAVYRGIDLIKFICSLLVVAIHVAPLYSFSRLLNYGLTGYLARLAVPFFFTASGFFVFRKIDRESFEIKPIGRYAGRIFRLYGIWCCIAFVGSNWQFWYLIGVVVAVVFIGLLVKEKLSASKIIIIVSILYVIGLLGDSYNGLIAPLDSFRPLHILFELYEMLFDTTRNGFFMGSIFVAIGMLFAYFPIKMSKKTAVFGFSVSMIFLLTEAILLKWFDIPRDCNMYFFLVPATFFLFYIATHLKLKESKIFDWMRVAATITFFSHMFIYWFVSNGLTLLVRIGFPAGIDNSVVQYSFTVLGSLLFSTLIYWASKKERFYWLKWLYS